MRAIADESELVAARLAAGDCGSKHQCWVLGAVDGDLKEGRIGFGEQLLDVGAGKARGDQPESRQR